MTSREIIKRLEEDGWYHVKTTGDHYQMKHPTKPGKVTIVHPAKDFSIGTLRSIEKQSGVKSSLPPQFQPAQEKIYVLSGHIYTAH